MAPPSPRIGIHLPLGQGLPRAAARAATIGVDAIQVFADNPNAWARRARPPKGLERFTGRLTALGIDPVVIHAAYLVNLAGPRGPFRHASIRVLAAELRAAPGFGATVVNVHTGSHRGTSLGAGIRRVGSALAQAIELAGDEARDVTITLENAAGGGWTVGTNVPQLARLAEAAARACVPEVRLAFCLDTAHAWGAGARFDDPEAIDAWLAAFDAEIGLRRLALVHLNDSRSECGSHHDRHEHLGAGRIGPRGLGHLLRHPRLADVPFILETPGMDLGYDAVNLARARVLAADEPLDPLPPEAFNLPGSRTRGAAPPAT